MFGPGQVACSQGNGAIGVIETARTPMVPSAHDALEAELVRLIVSERSDSEDGGKRPIKVVDRRAFTADGERRESAEAEESR